MLVVNVVLDISLLKIFIIGIDIFHSPCSVLYAKCCDAWPHILLNLFRSKRQLIMNTNGQLIPYKKGDLRSKRSIKKTHL